MCINEYVFRMNILFIVTQVFYLFFFLFIINILDFGPCFGVFFNKIFIKIALLFFIR